MYGVAKDITMGAAGRVPYRTKIPNVLLAGQNVNSHGMLGVLVGTIVTCSELVPSDIIYRRIQAGDSGAAGALPVRRFRAFRLFCEGRE